MYCELVGFAVGGINYCVKMTNNTYIDRLLTGLILSIMLRRVPATIGTTLLLDIQHTVAVKWITW